MRKRLFTAASAGAIVSAPVLLDHAFPLSSAWSALLVTPLLPGLYLASLAEHVGAIEAMDSQGDLTLAATTVMYVGSLVAWLVPASAAASFFGRKSRSRVA
jgi:hypothetical protein